MINSSRLAVNLLKKYNKNFLKFSIINFSTVETKSKDFNNNNNNYDKNGKQNFYYENKIKVFLALAGLAGMFCVVFLILIYANMIKFTIKVRVFIN